MLPLGEVIYTTTLTVSRHHKGKRIRALFPNYCGGNNEFKIRPTGILTVKRKCYTKYVRIPLTSNVYNLVCGYMFYLQNSKYFITTSKFAHTSFRSNVLRHVDAELIARTMVN